MWSIATATFKTETYRFLRLERPSDEDRSLGVLDPPGTVHLPDWIDTEWLMQLAAEQLVTIRNKRGYLLCGDRAPCGLCDDRGG